MLHIKEVGTVKYIKDTNSTIYRLSVDNT